MTPAPGLILAAALLLAAALSAGAAEAPGSGKNWLHPAGLISRANVREMREKARRYPWAQAQQKSLEASVRPWLDVPLERLRELTPRRRANVYHNFTCPDDHSRFTFERFNNETFTCPTCRQSFPATQASNVYPPGDTYHGTFYDGWACLYFIDISHAVWRMGLVYQLTGDEACARRAADILLLYADLTPGMSRDEVGGSKVIFTYNREGEARLLEFAGAYELIRDSGAVTPEQQAHIERDFLKPFCDDVFMDPEMRADWNNVYWWQLAIAQVGVALEDRRYLDYAFGLGDYGAAKRPEHRSLAYSATHHFLPDGAHFGLNSGYQLYPLTALLQTMALGANLAEQEPERFPAAEFDTRDPRNPVGGVARRAIYWYLSIALPDYTMSIVGDSMLSRDSMKVYDPIAELAYRYFGVNEVAYYPEMASSRGLWGLLWGAPTIERRPVPFASARLPSSGFTALRAEAGGKRLYVGLNHLQPGDGHNHADRLGIITYACDRLLGLEKGTPYNDNPVRAAAGASYSHNTVTVDRTSQPMGNQLKGEQIPRLRWFQSQPGLQLAEVWADGIYRQTTRYRRLVAIVDDTVVDVFDVVGGQTRDWLYHCAGSPAFDLPMQPGEGFDTPAYVVGGTSHYERATTEGTWTCTWTVPANPTSAYPGRRREVQHRLTMLGAPGTEVYRLGTYPVQATGVGEGFSANLTAGRAGDGVAEKPPDTSPFANRGQSLLARRTGSASPFVALYDTYHDRPSLQRAEVVACDVPGGVVLRWAAGQGERWLVYNPSPERRLRFAGPWGRSRLDGHLALVRRSADGTVEGVTLLGATGLKLGDLAIALPAAGNVFLTRTRDGRWVAETAADLAYETIGGHNLAAPCPGLKVRITEGQETAEVSAPPEPGGPGPL